MHDSVVLLAPTITTCAYIAHYIVHTQPNQHLRFPYFPSNQVGVRREELPVQQGAEGCGRAVRTGLRGEQRAIGHTGAVCCVVGLWWIVMCIVK